MHHSRVTDSKTFFAWKNHLGSNIFNFLVTLSYIDISRSVRLEKYQRKASSSKSKNPYKAKEKKFFEGKIIKTRPFMCRFDNSNAEIRS